MKFRQTPPNLFIYSPDQRIYKGMVVNPLDFTVDYNFNALSQIKFRVNKFIYDINTYTWIKNPCYDALSERNVIRSSDTSHKFKFQGSTQKACSLPITQPNSRDSTYSPLGFNVTLNNAKLQDEVALFDIGSASGYIWQYYSYINDNGAFVDASSNNFYYDRIACKEFFPVQVGDIIAMGSKNRSDMHFSKNGTDHYSYRLHFYSSSSASSHLTHSEFALYNPVGRVRVTEDMLASHTTGYVRIEAKVHTATLANNDTQTWTSNSPREWFVKIYSGERRCSSITVNPAVSVSIPQCLWVIKDVDVTKEYFNEYKEVTLYSYDYVLSYKSLSLSEGTLPLYIPDDVVQLVNSQYFIVDSVDGSNYNGAQRMSRGLINQVLDYLPCWTVGYINPNVVTRYRTVSEVDNGNIYSFLVNAIQPLYQCYFIFNTEQKTINILSQSDIVSIQSATNLTWSNTLKSLKASNIDTQYVTALRIHTAEDQYGIGLINPTGNNVIYNFSHIKNELDFVVDNTHINTSTNRPYTLKEVIEVYEKSIADTISGAVDWGYVSKYREESCKLVEATNEMVKLNSQLSKCLAEYLSVADTINVYLQDDFKSNTILSEISITDTPRTPESMQGSGIYAPNGDYSYYHSKLLYDKLYATAKAYYECLYARSSLTTRLQHIENYFKYIALVHSLDCKTLWEEKRKSGSELQYRPIFTPLEAEVLYHYIYEADWTDENAMFSDTYSAQDIVSTLVDTYNNAKNELANIYCKPTYEFETDLANISTIPEMQSALDNLYLGNALYIVDKEQIINPVLLNVHIDYSNPENFTMQFSTDYKRKPLELRFSDLFGTISQVSVETPTFTFDT